MIALHRILVPTDFSESADKAVRYGVDLSRKFDARLHLLHVASADDLAMLVERQRVVQLALPKPETSAASGLDGLIREAERDLLSALLTDDERDALHPEYVLRTGRLGGPDVEIVRYAREQAIDLIVLGTHGHRFMAHPIVGSVAERVVRKAPCPVLTVRHPEHEFVVPDVS